MAPAHFVTIGLLVAPVEAHAQAPSCFERQLSVSRYHYPNPSDPRTVYQDLYRLVLMGSQPAQVTQLSDGATHSPPFNSTGATWSPDGTRVLFASDRSGQSALYLMDGIDADGDGEGDNLQPILLPFPQVEDPDWHASGTVAFTTSDPDAGARIALGRMDAGIPPIGDISEITPADADSFRPRWSPSGERLIYTRAVTTFAGRFQQLHAFVPQGATDTVLSDPDLHEYTGDWLDEDTILFASDRDVPSVSFELHRATVSVATPPHLSGYLNESNDPALDELDPTISDDGACLAFLGQSVSGPIGPRADLYVRDLASGDQRRVTVTRDIGSVAWLPDGAPTPVLVRAASAGPTHECAIALEGHLPPEIDPEESPFTARLEFLFHDDRHLDYPSGGRLYPLDVGTITLSAENDALVLDQPLRRVYVHDQINGSTWDVMAFLPISVGRSVVLTRLAYHEPDASPLDDSVMPTDGAVYEQFSRKMLSFEIEAPTPSEPWPGPSVSVMQTSADCDGP